MNPLYFVGRPDGRSALLAALIAAPWLACFARGWLARRWLWAAFGAAAILFPLSIALVQVPLQRAAGAATLWLLGPAGVGRYLLLAGAPAMAISGLVQESAKLLVALVALRRLNARGDRRAGLAIGAAAGVGYGAMEAFWVFNLIFAAGWSWATVQLQGPAGLVGFFERLYAVPFHAAAAALAAYGYASGRPWRFLLLAAGLHSALNYGALLASAGVFGLPAVEAWGVVITALTVGLALWLRFRSPRS
ncbi:MAG: hypothetical protein K6V36_11650 [Anaerolineae bacterium]|nr:hypothetical protein [Anaerolineae bacterium]